MYRIYKIIDNTNDNIYIGKTKQKYLSTRMATHKNDFKRGHYCSSQIILKNNDWRYELIEEGVEESREEYWIKNTDCVNKVIPGGDSKDWNKRWYDNNKDKIKEKTFLNRDKHNQYKRNLWSYQNSWGGNKRYHNNLLCIDVNLFI